MPILGVPIRLTPPTVAAVPEVVVYRVRPGQTLWDIAGQFGVSWHTLVIWNPEVDPVRPRPGQPIRVPVFTARSFVRYIVQPTDTLWRLGERFGASPWDIALWSGVPDPNRIFPGQILRIPLS